ncbi:MAG TPA: nitroreductase [Geminicoccaceae bacterium]|nr:nitroreductase [Geminicoccaceae bacterium]
MDAIEAILGRRTVPQVKMGEPGPDETALRTILEAGTAAPDHGRLRPWRFLLVRGAARERLGELFVQGLLAEQPEASPAEIEKQRTAPLRVPLLIVLVARTDPKSHIPVVEQLASTATAGYSILLATHALGFAGKWSTGRNAYNDTIRRGLGLGTDDAILGFLYIGSQAVPQAPSPRPELAEIVREWHEPEGQR